MENVNSERRRRPVGECLTAFQSILCADPVRVSAQRNRGAPVESRAESRSGGLLGGEVGVNSAPSPRGVGIDGPAAIFGCQSRRRGFALVGSRRDSGVDDELVSLQLRAASALQWTCGRSPGSGVTLARTSFCDMDR